MRKILIFITLGLIAVTSLVIGFTGDLTLQRTQLPADSEQGEALIGGDFLLTDTTGKAVRDADFRGKIMLVFFGFTHCPDICPVTVATLSKVMEQLGDARAQQVAPIFISVDPERDTPEVLGKFLAGFDKRIIGLTGTPEQVKQAASVYRAYYAKSLDVNAAKSANYSVDHSGFVYVMDKQGKFLKAIPYNKSPDDMLSLITPHLE